MSGFCLQCLGGVVHHDPAALDQIAMGDDFERRDRVLLDQQDREPFIAVDPAEDLENFRDQERRQPEAWLVEHQQFWLGHQGAADRQHLLFTAGEIARRDRAAFVQAGKIAVYPFLVAVHVLAAVQGRGRDQDSPSGVRCSNTRRPSSTCAIPSLTRSCGISRRCSGHGMCNSPRLHLAALRGEQAADRFQRCAFPRAIGAEQGHHSAFGHLDRDALDRERDIVVDDFDVVERQALGGDRCGSWHPASAIS